MLLFVLSWELQIRNTCGRESLAMGIHGQATYPGKANPLRRVCTPKRNRFRQLRSLSWMTRAAVTQQESAILRIFNSAAVIILSMCPLVVCRALAAEPVVGVPGTWGASSAPDNAAGRGPPEALCGGQKYSVLLESGSG